MTTQPNNLLDTSQFLLPNNHKRVCKEVKRLLNPQQTLINKIAINIQLWGELLAETAYLHFLYQTILSQLSAPKCLQMLQGLTLT